MIQHIKTTNLKLCYFYTKKSKLKDGNKAL